MYLQLRVCPLNFLFMEMIFFCAIHNLNQILETHVQKITGQGQGQSLWQDGLWVQLWSTHA